MNTQLSKLTYIHILTLLAAGAAILIAGALSFQPTTAAAETAADCPAGDCLTAESDVAPANHNTTRSNQTQSTVANPNVCDGVTCGDGSCATTADQCDAGEVSANHNTTRSNQTQSTVLDPGDCNDEDCAVKPGEAAAVDPQDCDDTDPRCSPDASVRDEGVDNDCDGNVDEGVCGDTDHLGTDPNTDDRPRDNATDWVVSWGEGEASTEPGNDSCAGGDCLIETDAAAIDTNICDGVTCADGSCAPTADLCEMVEAESANYNNTRSNRSNIVSPTDSVIVPSDPARQAQSHNSSRSNRTEDSTNPDYLDPDDDGDGIPTTARGGGKASPKLFDTLRQPSATPGAGDLDADGMSDVLEAAQGFMKFDDIAGEVQSNPETGERQLSRVALAAKDLRNWTANDRESFMRLRQVVASNTPEHVSLEITNRMLANDRIEHVETDQTSTRIQYRTNLRLFGLIPIEREIEARANANGEVQIDYPWYRFLSRVADESLIRNTTAEIQLLFIGADASSPSISETL